MGCDRACRSGAIHDLDSDDDHAKGKGKPSICKIIGTAVKPTEVGLHQRYAADRWRLIQSVHNDERLIKRSEIRNDWMPSVVTCKD